MSLTDTHITVRRTMDKVTVNVKHSLGWFHTRTKRFRFAIVEEHDRPNWYRLKRLLGLVDFQPKATLVPLDRSTFSNHDYEREKTFTVDDGLAEELRDNGYDWISQKQLYDEYEKQELPLKARRAWRNYDREQGLDLVGEQMLRSLKHNVDMMQFSEGSAEKQAASKAAADAIRLCLVLGDDMDAEMADQCDVIYGTRIGDFSV